MNLENFEIVEIDTVWAKLPKSFYDLNPATYRAGNVFYCFVGEDPQQGVLGCGDSPEEAVLDWHCHLNAVSGEANRAA